MRLEDIEIDEVDKNREKIIRAIKKLLKGAIRGISGYGHFEASVNDKGFVVMRSTGITSPDNLSINLPDGVKKVSCSGDNNGKYISFSYSGGRYQIYF